MDLFHDHGLMAIHRELVSGTAQPVMQRVEDLSRLGSRPIRR